MYIVFSGFLQEIVWVAVFYGSVILNGFSVFTMQSFGQTVGVWGKTDCRHGKVFHSHSI